MPETSLNSYQVIRTVHSSLRFSLYLAKQMETGTTVLIKTPDTQRVNDELLKQDLVNEANAHLKLSQPRIRKVFEIREEKETAYLIGEYIEGMSLASYLKINFNLLTLKQILSWLQELLEAFIYAHKQGCVHLNLNPYNIIVDDNDHLNIIGFGKNQNACKTAMEKDGSYHPLLYVAPELYQSGVALPQADLFSFAVIAYQMLCGVVPWRIDLQLSPEKQKQQSLCRAVIMPEIMHKEVPDWLFAALLQCLKLDPHLRFSNAEELLQVFNKQENWLPEEVEKVEKVEEVEKVEVVEEVEKVEVVEKVEKVEETANNRLLNSDADKTKEINTIDTPATSYESEIALPQDLPVADLANKQSEHQKVDAPGLYGKSETTISKTVPPPIPPAIIKETTKLKKVFKVLIWLSIIILLFVIVKYIAFGNRPKFTSVADSTQVEISEKPQNKNLPIAMVLVPADTLVMGDISPEAEDDEFPLLTIGISAFYISKMEISQAEWMMVFPKNPAHSKDPELPVENVNFYDIIDFCNQKSVLDGFEPCYDYYDDKVVCNFSANGYRLPTEA
ncbi:MAG TPA: bifunctional serine/threonine-protein kinase/formylglycine-generating enzyme family protein, partial [Candidatus Cloacimonas sp.]|nr:bifunctional serine/threonine-protein kinase/formylglycine-generating enzyme family protein [Candidatus Cloacimonas sp.]